MALLEGTKRPKAAFPRKFDSIVAVNAGGKGRVCAKGTTHTLFNYLLNNTVYKGAPLQIFKSSSDKQMISYVQCANLNLNCPKSSVLRLVLDRLTN